MSSRQVIVVGAGISGLACALRLSDLGADVHLIDAAENPGGIISTVQRNGFLFESGPQSFRLTPELRELIRATGCESELLEANPHAPRYILRGGKLRPAPMSPPSLLTTSLLSASSKMRILSEAFRRSRPAADDESLANFVRRKFGAEILEYLAGPFVSGVFAGDPEKLSLRSAFPSIALWEEKYGSVIRGAMKSRSRDGRRRPTLASFKMGMGTLPKAIAKKLRRAVAAGVTANSIESAVSDGWTIRCSDSERTFSLHASAIVLATPAYSAAKILAPASEGLAAKLAGIFHAPIAVVALGYRREHVGHALNGFGFLVPRTEKLRTLGVIWNSSLFPGRCPQGMVLMTTFLGGATDPKILDMEDSEIVNQVQRETAQILQISAPPFVQQIWRHARALPQYNLGHAQRVAAIRDDLSNYPGLFIAGNYLDGPSIGSCVLQGIRTAQSVRDYLARE